MTTAAEHLAAAEQLLEAFAKTDVLWVVPPDTAHLQLAQAHLLAAITIELGTPVTQPATQAEAGQ